MGEVLERDHDLQNRRKADEFSFLKYHPRERRQEYLLGWVKVRTVCAHRRKTKACGDRSYRYADDEHEQNRILREGIDTSEIDAFVKHVDDGLLYEQEWFWLQPGDLGVDDPCGYAEAHPPWLRGTSSIA